MLNVDVNLRHMRMLRHFRGMGGHEACNCSKGIFCIKKRIGNKTVLIHTGCVDAMWGLSNSAIPCCDQSQRPSESKADAKHQGLAMALAKLQRKPFGEDRSDVAEVHGDVREGKKLRGFSRQNSLQITGHHQKYT